MSTYIEAPYGAARALLILPSADQGDESDLDVDINHRQTMDGTNYTYVKSSARKLLRYTWTHLGRGKLHEILEFYKVFSHEDLRLKNWYGEVWKVQFVDSNLDTTISGRASPCGDIKEHGSVTIEFKGTKISG